MVEEDRFANVKCITSSSVIETYQCMSDTIRRVVVCGTVLLEYTNGDENAEQQHTGFIAVDDTLIFLSSEPLRNESSLEAAFVCMSMDLPSKLFKDTISRALDPISVTSNSEIWSTPSMLFKWKPGDTLGIRGDEKAATDFHTDVSKAASRISKYMRVVKPLSAEPVKEPHQAQQPIKVDLSRKRPRDAREFREQILSNGAQAEFFVWSQIKARYGDAADLSWWLTSTKRQFFPTDLTPIDDSIGSDFFIPKDDYCLFAKMRGGPVHVEVKGTGRFCGFNESVSFEISRNELKMAEEAIQRGEEYVVAVVSGLAGINRPRLETIVRDFSTLELVPTRFIATVPPTPAQVVPGPSLTKSAWY